MRLLPAALAVLALLAAGAPVLRALPPVDEVVIYAGASGTFLAGIPAAAGVSDAGFGAVNLQRLNFQADACHRDLHVLLGFTPSGLAVGSGGTEVRFPFLLEVRLADGTTGEPLPNGTLQFPQPGAIRYPLPAAGAVRADLYLRRGAAVNWTLRLDGWRAPEASCTWQGRAFINEVEANPPGIDVNNESVEILNAGFNVLDLTGWKIAALHGVPAELSLSDGPALAAGDRAVIRFPGQFLDNTDEVVVLVAPDGWVVDRTPLLTDALNDARTWQRSPDGSEEWLLTWGTLGAPNP